MPNINMNAEERMPVEIYQRAEHDRHQEPAQAAGQPHHAGNHADVVTGNHQRCT